MTLLVKRKTHDQELFKEGGALPQELITNAENKLQGFKEVKSDSDTKMLRVHEAAKEVQKTIKSNLYDKAGKTGGHLVQKEADYLAWHQMRHLGLEQLLRKDEAHWTKHIQASKKKAKDVIS